MIVTELVLWHHRLIIDKFPMKFTSWTTNLVIQFLEKLMYMWKPYSVCRHTPDKSRRPEAPSVDCGVFARDARESVDKERNRKKSNSKSGDPNEHVAAEECPA